jgi:hypothetical protein
MREEDRLRGDLEPGGMAAEPDPGTDGDDEQRAEDEVDHRPAGGGAGADVTADERDGERCRKEPPQDVHAP